MSRAATTLRLVFPAALLVLSSFVSADDISRLDELVPPPSRPAPLRLVSATPFTMREPLLLDERAAPLQGGSLVVVETSPAQLEPRQGNDWLVSLDGVPAQCLNGGYPSGRLVCIVNGADVGRAPLLAIEDAPERIAARHDRLDAMARLRGAWIGRRPRGELEAAREQGGASRDGLTPTDLRRWIARTIRTHSPAETGRAAALERSPAPR